MFQAPNLSCKRGQIHKLVSNAIKGTNVEKVQLMIMNMFPEVAF